MVGVLLLALAVAFAAHFAIEIFWAASNALDAVTNVPLATATVVLFLSVSACFERTKRLLGNTWVRMHLWHRLQHFLSAIKQQVTIYIIWLQANTVYAAVPCPSAYMVIMFACNQMTSIATLHLMA